MNKKLLALVMIIIVLGTLFAGCTMFNVDENRNYHQVVATVNYKNMTADIYRGDVLTYVLNYGGQYIQNYGMTPEQVVEYFYNNLSKQKLLLLYAKHYVAFNGLNITKDGNPIPAVKDDAVIASMLPKDFLSVDELRYCIELTNKQFDDLWKENISSLEKEQEANKGEDTSKPEDEEEKKDKEELAARPVKPAKTPSTEYVDEKLTDVSKLPSEFETKAVEKINAEKDKTKKSNMRIALNTLKKDLDKNFHDYNYFLEQNINSRIIAKYEKDLGKDINIEDAEIIGRYNKLFDTDLAKYIDEDTYASAVEASTFSLYHTNPGYSQVKSILISFNDTQKNLLKLVKESVGNEDYVKQFRNDMALGRVTVENGYSAELVAMLKDEDASKNGSNGITVNVSNPKYDAKEDELKDAYTDRNLPLSVVLYAMADGINAKIKEMDNALQTAEITDTVKVKAAENYAKKSAFVDWTYLVNDDPGMFQSDSYTITRGGRATTYVEEFTILGRELASQGVGSLALTEKGDEFKSEAQVYEGETEMFKAVNAKQAKISKKAGVESTVANDEKISTDIYTLTTEDGNAISYIINDFGIHIILVVDEPFDENAEGVEKIMDSEKPEEVKGYKLGLTYVYENEVKITYKKDADGNETEEIDTVEVNTKTIKDYVKDLFKKEIEGDRSTNRQSELFTNEDLIVKNEKVYKKILDELIKA